MTALFLNFPAELRVKIYELLIGSSTAGPIKIHHKKEDQSDSYAALSRVNRQLRHEYLDELRRSARPLALRYDDIQSCHHPFFPTIPNLQIHLLRGPSTSTYMDLLPLLYLRAVSPPPFTLTFASLLNPTRPYREVETEATLHDYTVEIAWANILNAFFAHEDPAWLALIRDTESVLAGVQLRIEEEEGRLSHLRLVLKAEHERGDPGWEETDKVYLRMLGMKGSIKELSARRWTWWRMTIVSWGREKRGEAGLGR